MSDWFNLFNVLTVWNLFASANMLNSVPSYVRNYRCTTLLPAVLIELVALLLCVREVPGDQLSLDFHAFPHSVVADTETLPDILLRLVHPTSYPTYYLNFQCSVLPFPNLLTHTME